MKNRLLIITLTFTCMLSMAQSGTIADFENRKTGNFREVLNSFYQLTTKNLTGAQKSLAFNSTLFAIKASADPDLYIDRNFVKERFSRNLQLNFKVNLDQTFSYTGFTGGLTYAIVNERDAQLATFRGSDIVNRYDKIFTDINRYSADFISAQLAGGSMDEKAISAMMQNLNTSINNFLKSRSIQDLPLDFQQFLTANGVDKTIQGFDSLLKDYYQKVQKAALWTIYTDGGTDKKGGMNKAMLGTTFLKGDFAGSGELDLRSVFTYSDTLLATKIIRRQLVNTIGLNFSLLKVSKTQESIFEIKAYGEYNRVFSLPLAKERRDNFLANADVRVRLWEGLWIPVTIKYDIQQANVFGFLNVTYNFDQFK